MSFWTFWGDFGVIDAVVIAVIALLALSAVERTRSLKVKTNKQLLTANWAVVVALFLSLEPVYERLDPLLGGHNFTNLFQRALIAYAGYAVTYSLAEMARRVLKEKEKPACMCRNWFYLSIAGTVIAFIWMGAAAHTSRGLEGYAGEYLAYTLYQVSTLFGLLVGARYLIPRLWRIAQGTTDLRTKLQLRIFIASYFGAGAAALFFALSPISPVMIGLREFFIYATFASLAVGFMLVNRERRSLIAASGRLRQA
ncbi:hypothetical protein [Rothia nasimurium]|uniref:hypothetical protein n=1 Tax=Rothia nasimurium TaxID=85336 RepID=UPI001F3627C9|nr:hypothetical protein [Rothia nasimurium]